MVQEYIKEGRGADIPFCLGCRRTRWNAPRMNAKPKPGGVSLQPAPVAAALSPDQDHSGKRMTAVRAAKVWLEPGGRADIRAPIMARWLMEVTPRPAWKASSRQHGRNIARP